MPHRRRCPLEITHRSQTDIQIKFLTKSYIQTADTTAHRGCQRTFDGDHIFLEGIHGFFRHPRTRCIEGFFACQYFFPRYFAFALISLFNSGIQHTYTGIPNIGTDSVTFNIWNDWICRNQEFALSGHCNFLRHCLNNLNRHLLVQAI